MLSYIHQWEYSTGFCPLDLPFTDVKKKEKSDYSANVHVCHKHHVCHLPPLYHLKFLFTWDRNLMCHNFYR